LISKYSKCICLQHRNRSIRLNIAFEKGTATSESPSGGAYRGVGVRGGENLGGFSGAEMGGDVSREVAEEVVDLARLGVGG
jgi:hypothetical protein